MASVINSISPVAGAPGAVITVLGSGFDSVAQVACPVLVQTTFVDAGTLQAVIPGTLDGPSGGSILVAVFVQGGDGSLSNMVQFTVQFPALKLQSWTSIDAVAGEVPGFLRGGQIIDDTITAWMVSISQSVSGALLRRGLPLDPTQWAQADAASLSPSPVAVLELITRYGVAARLASAVSSQFSGGPGEWGFAKNLRDAFVREFGLLEEGYYDKLFRPAAATVESGQLVATGGVFTSGGGSGQSFTKGKVF